MPKSCVNRGRRSPTAVWIEKRAGGRYRIRWVDPMTGQVASEACGQDKAYARDRRSAKRAELRDGLSGRLPDKTIEDLRDALDSFMVGKSPHTIRKTKGSLTEVVNLCGCRRLDRVDRGFIMDFRSKRIGAGVAVATCNKDLRQIKSALSYAVDAGWLHSNPLWRWKAMNLREPENSIRVIEADEFEKLLKATTNPTFRVLLIVGYYQGLRRSELCNLRWNAVDLNSSVLRVMNVVEADELTKSRKNRTLPLHPKVAAELSALRADVPKVVEGGEQRTKFPHVFTWDNGDPYRADWATVEFRRITAKSGIPACTLHDLRRSFSTHMQRAGVDKATVKDLGGWSTISVVEKHYTGEVVDAWKKAIERLAASQGVA